MAQEQIFVYLVGKKTCTIYTLYNCRDAEMWFSIKTQLTIIVQFQAQGGSQKIMIKRYKQGSKG